MARQSCDPKVEVSLERDREAFLPAVLFVGGGVRRDLLMQGWSLPAPLYEALPMELLCLLPRASQ